MLGQTVTSGIVSGLHRNNVGIEQYEDFIQTDAAIYPGNSGGALVNLRGELVGINTAFVGASKANPGVGFAIPINMARNVADQILEFGEVRRGSLGITIDDPTPSVLRELKLPVSTATAPIGAVIVKVDGGSAGARAGLKSGDVVTDLGNTAVKGFRGPSQPDGVASGRRGRRAIRHARRQAHHHPRDHRRGSRPARQRAAHQAEVARASACIAQPV